MKHTTKEAIFKIAREADYFLSLAAPNKKLTADELKQQADELLKNFGNKDLVDNEDENSFLTETGDLDSMLESFEASEGNPEDNYSEAEQRQKGILELFDEADEKASAEDKMPQGNAETGVNSGVSRSQRTYRPARKLSLIKPWHEEYTNLNPGEKAYIAARQALINLKANNPELYSASMRAAFEGKELPLKDKHLIKLIKQLTANKRSRNKKNQKTDPLARKESLVDYDHSKDLISKQFGIDPELLYAKSGAKKKDAEAFISKITSFSTIKSLLDGLEADKSLSKKYGRIIGSDKETNRPIYDSNSNFEIAKKIYSILFFMNSRRLGLSLVMPSKYSVQSHENLRAILEMLKKVIEYGDEYYTGAVLKSAIFEIQNYLEDLSKAETAGQRTHEADIAAKKIGSLEGIVKDLAEAITQDKSTRFNMLQNKIFKEVLNSELMNDIRKIKFRIKGYEMRGLSTSDLTESLKLKKEELSKTLDDLVLKNKSPILKDKKDDVKSLLEHSLQDQIHELNSKIELAEADRTPEGAAILRKLEAQLKTKVTELKKTLESMWTEHPIYVGWNASIIPLNGVLYHYMEPRVPNGIKMIPNIEQIKDLPPSAYQAKADVISKFKVPLMEDWTALNAIKFDEKSFSNPVIAGYKQFKHALQQLLEVTV
jgi:hypothetical protein